MIFFYNLDIDMKIILSRKRLIFFYNLDIDMKIILSMKIILLNLDIDKLGYLWYN